MQKKENKSKPDTLRKRSVKNKHSHPLISYGKKELELLRYMSNSKNERLNIKAYSRLASIPRSTIYYILDKLIKDELIDKPYSAYYKITNKGINLVDVSNGGVGSSRIECRKEDVKKNINLSCHYLKYTSKIVDKTQFSIEKIKNLLPKDNRTLNLKNLTQHYIYFDDATIIINPKQIIIRIHDILVENTEIAEYDTFNKALKYLNRLRTIGIKTENICLESGHFARVKSILSESLSNIDNRYFLELDDGKKFWIDNSTDELEDETNDLELRGKIDNLFKDVSSTDSKFSDIDKIKDVLSMITKLELNRTISKIDEKIMPKNQGKLPSYFG